MFCKKDSLQFFSKFIGKHLYPGPFFNKVAGLRPSTLLKKRLCNIFLENTSGGLSDCQQTKQILTNNCIFRVIQEDIKLIQQINLMMMIMMMMMISYFVVWLINTSVLSIIFSWNHCHTLSSLQETNRSPAGSSIRIPELTHYWMILYDSDNRYTTAPFMEVCLGPCETFTMEFFAKIFNGF